MVELPLDLHGKKIYLGGGLRIERANEDFLELNEAYIDLSLKGAIVLPSFLLYSSFNKALLSGVILGLMRTADVILLAPWSATSLIGQAEEGCLKEVMEEVGGVCGVCIKNNSEESDSDSPGVEWKAGRGIKERMGDPDDFYDRPERRN